MFSNILGRKGSTTTAGDGAPPIPDPENVFTMPSEEEEHEATWLQWPHNFHRQKNRRNLIERYEESWVQMCKALHAGERVQIIVYNPDESERVYNLLGNRGCDMSQIDFYEWPTDGEWCSKSFLSSVLARKKIALVKNR